MNPVLAPTRPDPRVNHSRGKSLLLACTCWLAACSLTGCVDSREILGGRGPAGRSLHAYAWTGERMLLFGGNNEEAAVNQGIYGYLGDAWEYDVGSDAWRELDVDGAPTPRSAPASVWTGEEWFVWGGEGYDAEAGWWTLLRDGALFDPDANSWESLPDWPFASDLYAPSAFWTGEDVLMWGWEPEDGPPGARFDRASGVWHELPAEGRPASVLTALCAWTGEELLVWNGPDAFAAYTPESDSWRSLPPGGPPAASYALVLGNELALFGGLFCLDAGACWPAHGGVHHLAEEEWRDLPAPRSSRWPLAATVAGDRIFAWYGDGNGVSIPPYDPRAFTYAEGGDAWMPLTGTPPMVRYEASIIWTGQEVVLWGGMGPGEAERDDGWAHSIPE